jgi:hypothetical protein
VATKLVPGGFRERTCGSVGGSHTTPNGGEHSGIP